MTRSGRIGLAYMVTVGGLLLLALLMIVGPAQPATAVTVQPQHEAVVASFPSTTTVLAEAVDLQGGRLVAIVMPSTWISANLTFQASWDGDSYANLYDDSGNEVAVTVSPTTGSRYVVFDALDNMEGVRFVKVRSGTAAAAITQTTETSVTLVVRP
jgi:hypothetical protein